jgi:hypothetical protein
MQGKGFLKAFSKIQWPTFALAAVNKAEHQTDHGRINKAVFMLWQFFVGCERGVWNFQITQEFTLPPSARVKQGSHHFIWLVVSWQQSVKSREEMQRGLGRWWQTGLQQGS